MNPFAILKQQVKKALTLESTLEPEQRAMFDWQYLVNVSGRYYKVGKTGANTCYFKTPDMDEEKAVYPNELVDIIESWGKSKYVSFSICHKNFDNVLVDNIKEEERALKSKPKKFRKGIFICGYTPKGKRVKLWRLREGLAGSQWVAVERESKP
ncbi:hypothetical protein fHeYen902_257 [Yersinia phage fHe-Yen9-02]|nr:hypothetical protein fHeYen902_257 [Yersinia phage fHe-Yen9-02]